MKSVASKQQNTLTAAVDPVDNFVEPSSMAETAPSKPSAVKTTIKVDSQTVTLASSPPAGLAASVALPQNLSPQAASTRNPLGFFQLLGILLGLATFLILTLRQINTRKSLPKGFNRKAYLDLNPDVKAAGVNPVLHFLNHGKAEGRQFKYSAV